MIETHLPLFRVGDEPVRFIGQRHNGRLREGSLTSGSAEIAKIRNGVARFASAEDNEAFAARARQENWIAKNWEHEIAYAPEPYCAEMFDALAATDGPILEIAAGPGGGNLPQVLKRNPAASIVVNDIVAQTMQLWHDFLEHRGLGPNVSFAAFDARSSPVRDCSIQSVSSRGGFDNILGHPAAIREAARVLVPRGRLFMIESHLEHECFEKLPEQMRGSLAEEVPGFVHGYRPLLEEIGLRIESCHDVHRRNLDPGEGDLPAEAAKLGVTLAINLEYIVACKQS